MSTATALASATLAAAITFAAVRKLSHRPDVVAAYARAGVPEDRLNLLAVVLLAASFGLIAGLAWTPLGAAAAAGLVAYFATAVGFHVHAGDLASAGMPIGLALLALATLILHVAGD